MRLKLFLLFMVVPAIELAMLIKVGALIGTGYTVLLVLGAAIAGAYMVRLEGFNIMTRFTSSLSQGIFPAEEIMDGALVLAGGILLITPGFFTDVLGLLLVFPLTRPLFKRWIKRYFDRKGNVIDVRKIR